MCYNITMGGTMASKTIAFKTDENTISTDFKATYPINFFKLFGSGKNLGLDEELEDIPSKYNKDINLTSKTQ